MFDIVALGETLIDFTPNGKNDMGMQLFSRNPGGAPANVLAMNAKLGGKTAFIGKVGADMFGAFLASTMQNAGIDVTGLVKTETVPTTLAFVQLDENGDRSFSFYRNPGADICLTPDEVPLALLSGCRVFHFGSVSLSDEPSRSATLYAAREAKRNGAIISYDPNYRAPLWRDERTAVRVMLDALALADIVKVSDEEMTLLTGETELRAGAEKLCKKGASLVMVTCGENGSYFHTALCNGALPAYDVTAVDTTGSGDAFLGAVLYRLAGLSVAEIAALSREELESTMRYGNAAGGLTATAKGAITAMPDDERIRRCVKEQKYRSTPSTVAL